jgi:hypothetical protein
VSGLVGGLVTGLLLGLALGLISGLGNGLWTVLVQALTTLLVIGLAAGLIFGLTHSETWAVTLAFAQLARRQHIPARLMPLLEDARERQVLRTVGPIYQFRHARLQDRLAGQAKHDNLP